MEKKRYIALTMLMILGMTLTGCSKEEITDETVAVSVNKPVNLLEYYIEKPQTKTFAPGQHVLYKRYYNPILNGNSIFTNQAATVYSGSLKVPEGYKVIGVNSASEGIFTKYNEYDAVDIWFVNSDTVSVDPVYNQSTNCYDYSDFGIVMIDLIDYGEIVPSK